MLFFSDDCREKEGAFTLFHINFVHFTVQIHQTHIPNGKHRKENGGLIHDLLFHFQRNADDELNHISDTLPHLQIRNGRISFSIQTVEGLQNRRRLSVIEMNGTHLRFPHGISTSQKQNGGENDDIVPFLGVDMIRIEDDEQECDHLRDRRQQHSNLFCPTLFQKASQRRRRLAVSGAREDNKARWSRRTRM